MNDSDWHLEWDEKKNELLKKTRNISFEDIQKAIEAGNLLDIVKHPNSQKYPNQRFFVVKIDEYVYLVPHVENKGKYFLKTIFPSRKMTKRYLSERRYK